MAGVRGSMVGTVVEVSVEVGERVATPRWATEHFWDEVVAR